MGLWKTVQWGTTLICRLQSIPSLENANMGLFKTNLIACRRLKLADTVSLEETSLLDRYLRLSKYSLSAVLPNVPTRTNPTIHNRHLRAKTQRPAMSREIPTVDFVGDLSSSEFVLLSAKTHLTAPVA